MKPLRSFSPNQWSKLRRPIGASGRSGTPAVPVFSGVGSPLSGGTEFTHPDFTIKGNDGQPLMAMNSHVRLAHPSQNDGVRMLRRGYNFTDGNDDLGRLDAGLFFIAYVRDPDTQYVPMQNKLSRDDGLMEYLKHTGSALFAVPPGVRKGGFIGEPLFA